MRRLLLALPVVLLASCGSQPAAPSMTVPTGIYLAQVPNFHGASVAALSFSFSAEGSQLHGGVRVDARQGDRGARAYKASYRLTSVVQRADGSLNLVAAADVGGDVGTLSFEGVLTTSAFVGTFRDARSSGSFEATYRGPFGVLPSGTVPGASDPGPPRLTLAPGRYRFTVGPCQGRGPIPAWVSQEHYFTVLGTTSDGYGGYYLSGSIDGSPMDEGTSDFNAGSWNVENSRDFPPDVFTFYERYDTYYNDYYYADSNGAVAVCAPVSDPVPVPLIFD